MDLADALIEFTNTIIPSFIDVERSASPRLAPSMLSTLNPFFTLMVMNIASLAVLALTLKLLGVACNLAIDTIRYTLKRASRAVRWLAGHRGADPRIQQASEFDTSGTDEACGRSWTEGDTGGAVPDPHHDELCEALSTLGLKASATETEIKKAYHALMKQYHPDRYMRAPRQEQERVKYITVRVRHAYDVLSREGHRLQ